jgi:hypothetical protein
MSRNSVVAGALAATALAGFLLPLLITKGPLRPTLVVDNDGPLPRQAGMRGPFVNRRVQCRTVQRLRRAMGVAK